MNAFTHNEFGRAAAIAEPGLGALAGIEVRLSIEVAAKRLTVGELMALTPDAVLPFDRRVDDLVDLLVNDRPFAKGEVVAVDDRYAIRITALVAR